MSYGCIYPRRSWSRRDLSLRPWSWRWWNSWKCRRWCNRISTRWYFIEEYKFEIFIVRFILGDHVVPLYIPQCGDCKFCDSPKTNLCSKIRNTQGKGVMPDGTSRFTCKGKSLAHFMGCSTFSEYTVVADISLAKVCMSADSKIIVWSNDSI